MKQSQTEWLRARIRSGQLDHLTYKVYVLEIYRLEREAEGQPNPVYLAREASPDSAESVASALLREIG